jgi:hypothetical protein
VPIYDTSLIALSVGLTLGALNQLAWRSASKAVILLGLLVMGISIVTEGYARRHEIQLITIAIALLGVVQTWLLHQTLMRGAEKTAELESVAVS